MIQADGFPQRNLRCPSLRSGFADGCEASPGFWLLGEHAGIFHPGFPGVDHCKSTRTPVLWASLVGKRDSKHSQPCCQDDRQTRGSVIGDASREFLQKFLYLALYSRVSLGLKCNFRENGAL